MTLNYIEHFLTLFPAFTVYIFISAFDSLVDISEGIMRSVIVLNISAISGRIKRYKPISKKKKKKHNEIALLAKTNLDYIKSSISRSFSGSFTY